MHVLILGAGPLGLMAALDAHKQGVTDIVVLDRRRGDYDRANVPKLSGKIVQYMEELGVSEEVGMIGETQFASLGAIEQALFERVQRAGIRVVFNVSVADFEPRVPEGKTVERVETMRVAYTTSDSKERRYVKADLLVVAVGGSANTNEFVNDLGFEWDKLKAKNYMAYGVVPADANSQRGTDLEQATLMREITRDPTMLKTQNSRYVLATLHGMTKQDMIALRADNEKLRGLLTAMAREFAAKNSDLMEGAKSVGIFKVKLRRARQVISPAYPAVLLGDAALTPHPQSGSGLVTGFEGFLIFQELLAALLVAPSENARREAFLHFNDRLGEVTMERALRSTADMASTLLKQVRTVKQAPSMRVQREDLTKRETVLDSCERNLADYAKALGETMKQLAALHDDPLARVEFWQREVIQGRWDELNDLYAQMKALTEELAFATANIDNAIQISNRVPPPAPPQDAQPAQRGRWKWKFWQ